MDAPALTSPSILEAVLSPDKTSIALLSGPANDLTLQWLTLSDATLHTLHAGFRCSASYVGLVWSPDGRHIYYAADDGNWFHDLWCVPLDGEPQQITDYFHTNTYPVAAHPDGETVLTISNLRGELNLRTLHRPTGDVRKITDYATPVKSAVYSPDGSQIAYTANATQNPYNTDIYIMNADGFNKRKILSTLSGAYDIVRDWDPTGRYLAVESNFEDGWQAGIYDLRTHKLRWYQRRDNNGAHAVSFSPDGHNLLARLNDHHRVYPVTQRGPGYHQLDAHPVHHALWLDADRILLHTADDQRLIYSLTDKTYHPLPTT